MIFIIITAVLVAFSYEPPTDSKLITSGLLAVIAAVSHLLVTWAVGESIARWAVRRLSGPLRNRSAVMRQYQRLRWVHAGALLGSYTGLIHAFDWPGVIRVTWGLGRWILVDDLLILMPFVASMILTVLSHFRVEELLRVQLEPAVHAPRWKSRLSHLEFHLRQHMGIVLLPLLILVTIQDVVLVLFEGSPAQSSIELGSAIAGLAGILILAPLFLRLLWRADSLPPGPLRARLDQLGRKLKFRSSDILIWNTQGAVINAAVAGILPWPRYVLLSDALLTHLTDDEIAAVFGHEIGHVRHHHLWFFMAFMAGGTSFLAMSIAALSPLTESLVGAVAASHLAAITQSLLLPLASVTVYFGIFFGFLSRRFERQADIFGCRAVSCSSADCPAHHAPNLTDSCDPPLCPAGIQVFVQALERIADLNGAMRDARSWRHFSIAKRVEFLKQVAGCPQLERSFQRSVSLLKALVLVALVAGVWYLWFESSDTKRAANKPSPAALATWSEG
jgi:STE24 endopeptidase